MTNDLLNNFDKIHTTALGIERIKKNLRLDVHDVVEWCKHKISTSEEITRKGKNWYVRSDNCVITVNASSYTIITAHMERKNTNAD
jgi:N-acetylglucosamine kinase-like BadF-type ATPase